VLLCAALDTYLTRAGHAYRPQDWLLPGQALLLWAAFGVLLALPMRWSFRREGAGLTAALAWMAAPWRCTGCSPRARRGRRLSLTGDGRSCSARSSLLVGLAGSARASSACSRRVPAPWAWASRWRSARSRSSASSRAAAAGARARRGPGDDRAAQRPAARVGHDARRPSARLGRRARAHAGAQPARAAEPAFETAWSASVFTLASHVSMLTGLPPALHGTTMRPPTVTAETVAPLFAAAGYRTGAFVGTAVLTGAGGLREGFDVYDDLVDPPVCDTRLWALVNDAQVLGARRVPALRHDGQPHWWQDFQRPAGEVLADAASGSRRAEPSLVRGRQPLRRALALRALAESRALWVRPYGGPLTGHLFRADDWPQGRAADASDKVHARDLYDGELWDLDRATGRFLDGLDLTSGTTAVLLTADHGEALGEHDEWSHEHPRVPQSRVPLLVCAPGRVAPGSRVSAPVSGVDVAPTLLDLAGLTPPAASRPSAARCSLSRCPTIGCSSCRTTTTSSPPRTRTRSSSSASSCCAPATGSTLHDTVVDPLDEVDLTSQQPALAAELGAALDSLQAAAPAEGGAVIDEDTLRALGYVGH
jgi:hypothetical protein